jgi:hypothetical protein
VYHKGKKKDEKMLDAIKKIFRCKHTTPSPAGNGVGERSPLHIEGVKPAPLTAEPDDAELAAQALLESMAAPQPPKGGAVAAETPPLGGRGAAYYHALADRIRTARSAEARLTMRLLASVEEQLAEPTALYKGQWGDTERKLYRAMDIAEREGGELHRRWQHCLANVLVRQMEEERKNEELRMKNEELSESPADNTDPSNQGGDPTDPNE